jgi:hypothetical protein
MKPDWQDAPPWAKWLTCSYGYYGYARWEWHECQPTYGAAMMGVQSDGRRLPASTSLIPTIEPRPLVSLMAGADTWPQTTNPDTRPGYEGKRDA